MKIKKNILFTFDYEPFLGSSSGTAENCLIKPTNALLEILKKYDAKGLFFIDTLYLQNLKNNNISSFDSVINQLKLMYNEGHFIFPHIHSHWLDAKFLEKEKTFSLNNIERYSLSSLSQQQINDLFKKSIAFLKNIGIEYESWGYRAGGWCIQPFHLFKDIFKEEHIKYDFSVLPGYKNEHPNQKFDFSRVKNIKPYFFNDDVTIAENAGDFIEFPISTICYNSYELFGDRLVRKYLWKTNDKGFGDGFSAQTKGLKSQIKNSEMISIDILTVAKLNSYKIFLKKNDYMHWISHPKMFTKHGLSMFDKFLNYSNSKYQINYLLENIIL